MRYSVGLTNGSIGLTNGSIGATDLAKLFLLVTSLQFCLVQVRLQ